MTDELKKWFSDWCDESTEELIDQMGYYSKKDIGTEISIEDGMDGIDELRSLNEREWEREAPIIFNVHLPYDHPIMKELRNTPNEELMPIMRNSLEKYAR